jgi:hypothetical protein
MAIYQTILERRYSQAAALFFLCLIALRLIGGKMLYELCGQPMLSAEYSYSFWALLSTGIPKFIITNLWACILLDVLIVLLPLALMADPSRKRIWTLATLVIFFIHTVTGEVFSCAHSKSVVVLFLVLLPLLFEGRRFLVMADFAKYFGISILLTAAFYKVVNGALLTPNNFVHVLINKHSDLAITYPESLLYQIAQFIIHHPGLAESLFILLFVTQVSFSLSIFTRRFDRWMIVPLAAFSITTYLFMGIYNYDILMLSIPLWFSGDIGRQYDAKLPSS